VKSRTIFIDRLVFVYENIFDESGMGQVHGIEFIFLMKPRGKMDDLRCSSHSMDGGKESLHWLPIDKLADVKLFPVFFILKFF